VKNPATLKGFGVYLRQLRERRVWSQQELADVADISKRTVQRIEGGKYAVTLDVLASLARAMSLPLKELLDFAEGNEVG
jgi:transcriptional regulator with XRE-family HTH domain